MTDNGYIFVTGGAGYIGSHTVRELLRNKYKVIVYDDLSEGHREFVPDDAVFVEGSTGDTARLDHVFSRYSIDTVIHFAGFLSEESRVLHQSVSKKLFYFQEQTRARHAF